MRKIKTPPQKIDTAALLANVDIVQIIEQRVPLKKSGAEYEACCPFHNETTPSFKVNPKKQFYHCFGCGANGDAIKFLVEYDGLSFIDACRQLGADVPEGAEAATPKRAPKARPSARAAEDEEKPKWRPVAPVPPDAPAPPVAHEFRGKPSKVWTYRNESGAVLGYVYRFEKASGGKELIPLSWCCKDETGANDWRWLSFAEPRPIYGLDRLAEKPGAMVLLVEGEKCADAAALELPDFAVVSWPGGGKAVDKVDWTPLAGRKVIAWADCDAKHERPSKEEKEAGKAQSEMPLLPAAEQPGVMAMNKIAEKLLALGCRFWDVKIPDPGAKPDGWDIADAIDEGLKGEALAAFFHTPGNGIERMPAQPEPPPIIEEPPPIDAAPPEKKKPRTKAGAGQDNEGPYLQDLIWGRDGLKNCLSNVYQIMAQLPEWRGVIAWDEFSLTVVKRKPPPFTGGAVGEWTATDDSLAAMWLSIRKTDWNFTPSSDLIAEAVEVLARANPFHPVREYLRGLQWDGQERLSHWLSDLLDAPRNEYTMRVGAWYLMGAVKRVLQPGCKFDYCLVLCGNQGKKKSSILDALAGEWFGDTDLDLGHKDSMSALRGKWIYEIAELGALARTEERRQKSFLSRRIDEYRPVYGRREIKAPRQLVFSGTTNEHEWNKDPTGGRRFWPVDVLVEEIDLDALRAMRDQLWAEALHRVDAGDRYWPSLEEQTKYFDPEQLKVEQQDSLVDALHDWVYEQPKEFSLYEAAVALKIDASKITRDLQTRLGVALRKLGCKRVEKRNGMTRFWYQPPEKESLSDTSGQLAQQQGGANAPF